MKMKLPERWRLARNVDEDHEVRFNCPDHGAEWFRVVSAIHMVGPIAISSFLLKPVERACPEGDRLSIHPSERLFTRRPAEVGA